MNWSDPIDYLLFAVCSALATYVQNLTGFAFSLVLLGLVSILHLASVADAANAATVLTLINAAVFFRLHKLTPQWRLMRPAIPTSLLGVVLGVALLGWLSGNAVQSLRAILGGVIILCAVLLLINAKPLAQLSGRGRFAVVGVLSGLMGGLFSSAGPPLVYHMYRQPLDRNVVKHCLVLMFAINQALRLVLVVSAGYFSLKSLILSASAVPVVFLVTWFQHRHSITISLVTIRRIVSLLLMLTGVSLIASVLLSQIAKGVAL